jgi:uncharacterized protein Yka (UPF0111/DUF47 family)
MSSGRTNVLAKVVGRIFPKQADFYALLAEQSALAVECTRALAAYMSSGNEVDGQRVVDLEKQADRVKEANLDALSQAFSTPMDREDLYRAIMSLDHVLNYAKTTVRELQLLGLPPDEVTLEMARLLQSGAESLDSGYRSLVSAPAGAEVHAQAARKAERNIEKVYRRALAELFDVEQQAAALEATTTVGHSGGEALRQVMAVFKKREVYRHMSNAGDRVARAGAALHDIVVKLV